MSVVCHEDYRSCHDDAHTEILFVLIFKRSTEGNALRKINPARNLILHFNIVSANYWSCHDESHAEILFVLIFESSAESNELRKINPGALPYCSFQYRECKLSELPR